ncbi:poly(ADP-ribose) glycohydrolase 1 [Ipomoea triloba]|uniref:poly(ADP-ribose) glycohydrolase 1 n=1 Tax=Ipomoea triloba TaxID=35885 RepID=UPI00125D671C|nr:poly(ADP-ribose) glycohydrolase 1 [Ipomoea triloba]
MENREDLRSILPYLPLLQRSSSLFWPPPVVEALKALSQGPRHSNVDSGEVLFLAISDIRNSLSLPASSLAASASDGYSIFFDDLIPRAEASKWFEDVVPGLANLLLRFPSLLETHYQKADGGVVTGVNTGLRLLESQESGVVFLSQELIGALLACAFFCLFPSSSRGAKHLPMINFDRMFAYLYDDYDEKLEHKLRCIVHYFGRICSSTPMGNVSFERKVLPMESDPFCISYPEPSFWSESTVSLCPFEVFKSGLIEDQSKEALEVDFANKYIGGGALSRGCVQEEIRFMINPELIAGMLFLPAMSDNEAIEIVGTERFSNYTGYASSFRFCGNYVDEKCIDHLGRRKRRITAIDALCSPGKRQYKLECLLREMNKAFCGFSDQINLHHHQQFCQAGSLFECQNGCGDKDSSERSIDNLSSPEHPSTSLQAMEGNSGNLLKRNHKNENCQLLGTRNEIGIVTGNWGCGAFGGDPELKAMIQWLAASQALRPFISYYTFDLKALQLLDQVVQWIISHEWTVGDLWNMLVDHSLQRLSGETSLSFFNWLLPSLHSPEAMELDNTSTP